MTLSDFLGALRRRWYVVLLGFALTGGLCYGAADLVPPSYTARGLIVLLPPQEQVGDGGNPLLGLGGLELPARVMVAYFSSDSAQLEIAEEAPDSEVAVTLDESTRGPVLAIDVRDPTAAGALSTLRLVADEIPPNLARLQEEVGAPANTTVTSLEAAMDTRATIDRTDTIRTIIAAGVIGLTATLVSVFLIDGIVMRRRARRKAVAAELAS